MAYMDLAVWERLLNLIIHSLCLYCIVIIKAPGDLVT